MILLQQKYGPTNMQGLSTLFFVYTHTHTHAQKCLGINPRDRKPSL